MKKIVAQKAKQALNKVAGSVELPHKYINKSLESIITDARSEYFAKKK